MVYIIKNTVRQMLAHQLCVGLCEANAQVRHAGDNAFEGPLRGGRVELDQPLGRVAVQELRRDRAEHAVEGRRLEVGVVPLALVARHIVDDAAHGGPRCTVHGFLCLLYTSPSPRD